MGGLGLELGHTLALDTPTAAREGAPAGAEAAAVALGHSTAARCRSRAAPTRVPVVLLTSTWDLGGP